MLPLPAPSVATLAATSTVTAPVAVGVIRAVYTDVLVAVNDEAVPLPTVMSPTTKPVTASEKVKVAVNGPVLVAGTPVIVTVGAVVSVPDPFVKPLIRISFV